MSNVAQQTRPSLLLRVRDAQDERAWQEFVELYTPLIFGYCRRRGLQEADAADVTQEVMRALARSVARLEHRPDLGGFRAWLFRVTRSKLNNHFEKVRRQPLVVGGSTIRQRVEAEPCPEEGANWDHEYRRHIFDWAAACVRPEVEEKTWLAFWQSAVEDQPARKVAAGLGLSLGAVYIAKSRVITRLREMVASVADDESASEIMPGQPAGAELLREKS
jgi:RNA polymerase sigma-70 factor (ECF subfamily)